MPAEFKWNRLIIHAGGEGEFVACFEANIETLLENEYDEVECDLGRCIGLGERSVALIQWAMVLFSACGKAVTLRLPSNLQSSMQTTPVPKSVTLEWVRRVYGTQGESDVMVADTAQRPRSDSTSSGRKSSRPIPRGEDPDADQHDQTDKLPKIGEDEDEDEGDAPREAAVRSQRGSEVHADTDALLRVSGRSKRVSANQEGSDADPTPSAHHDAVAEELSLSASAERIKNDSTTTDRRPEVAEPEGETITASSVRQKRGWKTSRWVDLGGVIAYMTLESSGVRREIGQELLVGREPTVDWIVDAPTVSKRHFRIFILRNRWHVQDMDSTNGTYLNYLELKGPPVPVSDGDIIALAVNENAPEGTERFLFEIVDEGADPE